MKRSNRVAVVLALCFQLASPTLARGNGPDVPAEIEKMTDPVKTTAIARSELLKAPEIKIDMQKLQQEHEERMSRLMAELQAKAEAARLEAEKKAQEEAARSRKKTLSADALRGMFHNFQAKYVESSGEVIFSGTTSAECMKKFSFSKGEGSAEIVAEFTYKDKAEIVACENEQVKCDDDNECVGLRSKSDATVKLGSECSAVEEVKVAFRDAYNVDSPGLSSLKDADGQVMKHKCQALIAREKAEKDKEAKEKKIAGLKKTLDCASCGRTEAGLVKKREALHALVEIGEKTEEDAEKEEKKLNAAEMRLLTEKLAKASNRKKKSEDGEESSSELEDLKEKISTLAAGDEALTQQAAKAYWMLVDRKLKDINVDPVTGAANALAELEELKGMDLTEEQYQEVLKAEANLTTRQNCLVGLYHPAGCQAVFAQVQNERRVLQPMFGADGKMDPNFLANGQATTQQNPLIQNMNGSATPQNPQLGQQNLATSQYPQLQNFPGFASLAAPQGQPQFVANAQQPSFSPVNSGVRPTQVTMPNPILLNQR